MIVRKRLCRVGRRRAVCGSGIELRASRLLLLAVALAGCGRARGAAEVESMRETGELRIGERLYEGPVSAPDRPVDLFSPTDILVVGDSIWVVDNGNDRVVVFDRRFVYLGEFGREGEGPGEFRSPTAIRRSGAGVMVVDMGNSRFTEFDRSGTVLRTLPGPSGLRQFGLSEESSIYAPSKTRTRHYVRIRGASAEEFGAWPHPVPPGERAPPLPEPQSVEVTAGDTVHVFDEKDAVLYKYTPEGDLVMRRGLPRSLIDSVFAERAQLISALSKSGYRVLDSPVSRDFAVTSTGDLLLIISAGTTVGLLIDPRTYEARRLVAPPVEPASSGPLRTGAVALVDSVLYLITSEELRSYRVASSR
jgi:DNA-binding beta-propeller fold protein YncE